ncbi:MAG: response regulator [Acidobacteriota bacterium]
MRILVIDDAADIRLFVSAVLEGAGHEVLAAADPMKGISLLTIADVDALVLDVMMPRFTGFELLEILRRDARNRMLPVLLLSSLSETKERVKGMRLGATDFLPKPFDPDELVVRIERMVSHHPVSAGGLVGDLDETGLIRVLQGLEQEERNGMMRLVSPDRHGWIELSGGRLVAARYGLLQGPEAMFQMILLQSSRFSFEPNLQTEAPSGEPDDALDISRLALKTAHMEDELKTYSDELPADDAGLFVVRDLSTGAHPARDLPFGEIYERIDTLPGVTIAELIAHEFAAAITIRLSVAVLARAAVIEAVIEGASSITGGEPN